MTWRGFWILAILQLIELHGPNGQRIEVNVAQISSIRGTGVLSTPHKGHFHSDVHCILTMTNGNFNAVTETCEQVNQLIDRLQ